MKKKLLTALLFLSILISGCSGTDSFSKTNNQNSETPAKTVQTNKLEDEKGVTVQETSNKEEGNGKNSSVTSQPKQAEQQQAEQQQAEQQQAEQQQAEQQQTSQQQTEPKPLLDDMIIKGIIVALVVVILILAWLVYDRHKMKTKLNSLNNPSPKPDIAPQKNVNNPPQISAPIVTTPSIQPSVNEQLTIRVGNLQHIGSREEQQDSFCVSNIGDKKAISEKGLMAVVADGMGGLEGGALISRLVTETFLNNYNNQFNFEPTYFLYSTAENAEVAVENYMKQTGINGGSTLIAVIIKDSQMNYVSVGDSHVYLLRDNSLTLLNKEHNFGALLKEKADRGEIDPREPYVNPKRNSLTAYIGMGSFKIVDRNAHPIILKNGDKVLLCSDGVYNALGDNALIAALNGDASTATRRIQSDILAQKIPSQDNFTAIILECVST